jgi:parallel beta-helix repeat protein
MIATVFSATVPVNVDANPSGMVSSWKFDEGNGTTASDPIGNNHGAIHGASWTTGIINSALSFNGAGDYVDCGADSSLTSLQKGTVAAWIYVPTNLPDDDENTYYGYGGSADDSNFATSIRINPGGDSFKARLYFEKPTRDKSYPYSDRNFSTGEWHHIVWMSNGNSYFLYVDGVSETFSMAVGVNDGRWVGDMTGGSNDLVSIGMYRYNGGNYGYFNGIIDEVGAYNRILSAGEIWNLVNPGNGTQPMGIYIKEDGSFKNSDGNVIHPPITVWGNTYTLDEDIEDYIVLEKSGIILDGNNNILNPPAGSPDVPGISLYSVSDVTVTNFYITNFPSSIILYNSKNNNKIIQNTLNYYTVHGISLEPGSDSNIIKDNVMEGNNIDSIGISLNNVYDNRVIINDLSYNDVGIHLLDSMRNEINGNKVLDNGIGLKLEVSDNNTISNNNISYNDFGISIEASDISTISNNNISYNDFGIDLMFSTQCRIFHNNLVDNENQYTIDINSWAYWDNGAGEGNYWSDYEGLDDGTKDERTKKPRPKGDGVGDTKLPHLGADWYPLMEPWTTVDHYIDIMKSMIYSWGLQQGMQQGFLGKLENVEKSIEKGCPEAALGQIEAFKNHCDAKSGEPQTKGKPISDEELDSIFKYIEPVENLILKDFGK